MHGMTKLAEGYLQALMAAVLSWSSFHVAAFLSNDNTLFFEFENRICLLTRSQTQLLEYISSMWCCTISTNAAL